MIMWSRAGDLKLEGWLVMLLILYQIPKVLSVDKQCQVGDSRFHQTVQVVICTSSIFAAPFSNGDLGDIG
jgi:hypothetical protein